MRMTRKRNLPRPAARAKRQRSDHAPDSRVYRADDAVLVLGDGGTLSHISLALRAFV